MRHFANLGPLLLFYLSPLVFHTAPQISSPSESDNACGELCSDIFALEVFELAPLKRLI